MFVKVFTLRFDPRTEAFGDEALRTFCRDKETLCVKDHFFVKDETPYLAVLLTYNLPADAGEPRSEARPDRREDSRSDYRKVLAEEDWPLFNALRDWRSGRAKAEGVPPYIILTNEHLAHVAREKPASLTALGQIRGIGEAKIKRYGRAILEMLGHDPVAPDAEAAKPRESRERQEAKAEEKIGAAEETHHDAS